MAEEFLSKQQVLEKLQITTDELEELIEQEKLTPESADEIEGPAFPLTQVEKLQSDSDLDTFDDASDDDILFDLDADLEMDSEMEEKESDSEETEDALVDLEDDETLESESDDSKDVDSLVSEDAEGKEEESGLDEFDFLLEDDGDSPGSDKEQEPDLSPEDVEEQEPDEKSPIQEEKQDAADEDSDDDFGLDDSDFLLDDDDAGADDEGDQASDDMITEVVDVSELESGEEDILSDIIEDSGDEVSAQELKEAEANLKKDASDTQDPTVDMTELDEETEVLDSEQPTSDITQLADDEFEDDDVAEILDEESDEGTDFDEEDIIDYEQPFALPEPAFPLWSVIALAVIFLVQLVAVVYITENTLQSGEPSTLSQSFNITRFFN